MRWVSLLLIAAGLLLGCSGRGFSDVDTALRSTLGPAYATRLVTPAAAEVAFLYEEEASGELYVGLLQPDGRGGLRLAVRGAGPARRPAGGPASLFSGPLRSRAGSAQEPVLWAVAGRIFDAAIIAVAVQTDRQAPLRVPVINGCFLLVLTGEAPRGPVQVTGLRADGTAVPISSVPDARAVPPPEGQGDAASDQVPSLPA